MKTKSDSESVVKHYYARADENKKKKNLTNGTHTKSITTIFLFGFEYRVQCAYDDGSIGCLLLMSICCCSWLVSHSECILYLWAWPQQGILFRKLSILCLGYSFSHTHKHTNSCVHAKNSQPIALIAIQSTCI